MTFTSHVYTFSKVNIVDGSSSESRSILGSDYLDFEALMKGEHNERDYEPVGKIGPS